MERLLDRTAELVEEAGDKVGKQLRVKVLGPLKGLWGLYRVLKGYTGFKGVRS